MRVQNVLLGKTGAIALLALAWANVGEAAHTLSFRALGNRDKAGAVLQVYVAGNSTPLFEKEHSELRYWSKPVRITLPGNYSNQPVTFRVSMLDPYAPMTYFDVMVSDVKIADENGRLMNCGEWHYAENNPNFDGYIGENNLLLEKEKFRLHEKGDYAEFTSDPVTNAPDVKIGYDDVTLVDSAGEEIRNYEVQPGETVTLRANVHNLGTVTAQNVKVGLYDIHWKEIAGEEISLSVGETKTVAFKWTSPEPQQSAFVRIGADHDNDITECDEYNNHACKIITGPHPYLWFYQRDLPAFRKKVADHPALNREWGQDPG